MTNYSYTRDVPDGPNNPSTDAPNLKQNTNSIDSLIAEDHISFGAENGGFHKQVRMPSQNIPSGLIDDSGTLYVKSLGNKQLFYTNGTSGNEYQITRVSDTNFSTFGALTNFQYNATGPITGKAGWTFLPGGLILQYGYVTVDGTGTYGCTIPITYSNIFVLYAEYSNNSNLFSSGQLQAYGNSSFAFQIYATNLATSKLINWWSIGN